jgi:hypothetical protein
MKKLLALLIAFLPALAALAQPDDAPPLSDDRLREVKAQKIAYLTGRLNLSPEEAQTFWPIYNAYDEARDANRKEMRRTMRGKGEDEAGLTEQQALERLNKGLELRQRELELERTYKDRFVKAIGAKRTVELIRAEHDFDREVLRRIRERMGPPPGGRPRH